MEEEEAEGDEEEEQDDDDNDDVDADVAAKWWITTSGGHGKRWLLYWFKVEVVNSQTKRRQCISPTPPTTVPRTRLCLVTSSFSRPLLPAACRSAGGRRLGGTLATAEQGCCERTVHDEVGRDYRASIYDEVGTGQGFPGLVTVLLLLVNAHRHFGRKPPATRFPHHSFSHMNKVAQHPVYFRKKQQQQQHSSALKFHGRGTRRGPRHDRRHAAQGLGGLGPSAARHDGQLGRPVGGRRRHDSGQDFNVARVRLVALDAAAEAEAVHPERPAGPDPLGQHFFVVVVVVVGGRGGGGGGRGLVLHGLSVHDPEVTLGCCREAGAENARGAHIMALGDGRVGHQ
ncbi:hypothetical protein BDZ88DRAFT_489039, partial [Geranomyces variabilis]